MHITLEMIFISNLNYIIIRTTSVLMYTITKQQFQVAQNMNVFL